MAKDKVTELKGIVRNTKDSASQDGECDEVINLRFKDNSWRPVGALKGVGGFESLGSAGYERLYVHTNEYRHLFGVRGGDLYWIGNVSDSSVVTPFVAGGGGVYSAPQLIKQGVTTGMRICQTGHLMVIIDDGLSYYLYRPHAERYDRVITDYNNVIDGRLLPYGNVELKVDLECCEDGRPFVFASHIESAGIKDAWGDATKVSEVMKDVIYKTQKDVAALNKFWGAFLCCTAAELYDGTFILMSQPTLMLAPNVKSSEHYQNWNTALLTDRTYTTVNNVNVFNANINVCDKFLSKNNSFSSQSVSSVAQDTRFGCSLLYSQICLNTPVSLATIGYKRKNNNIDYNYNKELITDTEFEVSAFDVLKLILGTAVNGGIETFYRSKGFVHEHDFIEGSYVVNQKEEIAFHSLGDWLGDRTVCAHYANKLKYRITTSIPAEYKDVIKNISVFITPQTQMVDLKQFCSMGGYVENPDYNDEKDHTRHIREFKYDYRTIANITKELMSEAMMYKIGEIKTEDFREANVGKWVDLKIEDGVLTNLLSQERLVVDANGRNSYNAKVAFPYNNRLHIADYVEELFHGWLMDHFWYNEGVGQFSEGGYNITSASGKVGWIKVTIDDDGAERTVVREVTLPEIGQGSQFATQQRRMRWIGPLLSYPDKNAKTMEIYIHQSGVTPGQSDTFHQTYTLTAHDFINIAYYITPDLKPIDTGFSTTENLIATPLESKATDAYHNRVKVSKTNNALYFPFENVYAIGNGKVLGMASNEMVLATGQIGDAPLYVFCSDGVYGLFVDSSGMLAYNFARVISEYVCNNAGGIFNIHGGVMFPTDKGYVLLEGLQAKDVTDKVEGAVFNVNDISDISLITNHARLVTLSGKITAQGDGFVEFIKGCTGGYNFADKEIWLTNKAKGYSYVIDRYGMFTKRTDCGVQLVNDFPRTYLLDVDEVSSTKVSTLRNLTDEEGAAQQTMFLTRAIKNDTQEFKQTERLVMRGEFHLPTTDEYNPRELDLTAVKTMGTTLVDMREPESVTTITETAARSVNEIVPGRVYANHIAVCDTESPMLVVDGDGEELDIFTWATFSPKLLELFRDGYMVNPDLGWQSFEPTNTNAIQFSITPDSNFPDGYDVKVRFGNDVVYKIGSSNSNVMLYFFDGWEGSYFDLVELLQDPTYKGKICYRWVNGTAVTNHGLYCFSVNAQTQAVTMQESIALTEIDTKSNYRFAYIYMDRSGTPAKPTKLEYEWYMSTVPTAAQDCYDFIQIDVMFNSNNYFVAARYNNLVNVAAGDNMLYLDENRFQKVTFRATAQQAVANTDYKDVLDNYNNGVYQKVPLAGGYKVTRNAYYRLVPLAGVGKTIYYNGMGKSATWAELWSYPAVTLYNKNSTYNFTNGTCYQLRIGYWDGQLSPAVYRRVNAIVKYIGVTGQLTLAQVYADWNSQTPVYFGRVSASDNLSGFKVILKAGEYWSVTYYSSSQSKNVTVGIRVVADEVVSGSTLAQRIESGYYPLWSAVDKLAGLYLYGSYDNKKWALLGAREQGGDYRDLGLIAHRVDCKYFRLVFVGQLKEGSSIEYIEQIVSDRVFRGKIR